MPRDSYTSAFLRKNFPGLRGFTLSFCHFDPEFTLYLCHFTSDFTLYFCQIGLKFTLSFCIMSVIIKGREKGN